MVLILVIAIWLLCSGTAAEMKKERGFSQEYLATRLNVVRQTISKWEKGISVLDAKINFSLRILTKTL